MNYDKLMDSVKKHEGYRNKVYLDSLGKRTIGYGHLCVEDKWVDGWEYSQVELENVLKEDLQYAINQGEGMCKDLKISDDAKFLIIEMIFQLGSAGVQKFRNMWKALKEDPPNYEEASIQMLDSRWAKQTPSRAKEMSDHMRDCA
jgi:lysozyme